MNVIIIVSHNMPPALLALSRGKQKRLPALFEREAYRAFWPDAQTGAAVT